MLISQTLVAQKDQLGQEYHGKLSFSLRHLLFHQPTAS